ncbi:PD-(D/E)XK nuclease family protein [Halalkaliarchaeum desulfuricum]|uniref:PD-(D/E)XK nuclease family protein n=1 Tax=Halalkaliarchaeum desulfuricum TaxID=2055893 RepID=UPI00137A6910|nr:PD-(D/E)XK nuclease family protein [Halalkaliarchaeum desulfuricum]
MSVEKRLQELVQRLNRLPETDEPPPTTLQILGRNHQEQDWQRLLFHFLSPKEGHGLNHALLEHLLSSLSDRDDLDYTFSRLDLQDIKIETEVVTSNDTRPDAVLWLPGDWFICWELKLWASETHEQTRAYIDASSFPAIDLSKDDVPVDNRYYIYLAPESASPPEANEFVQISWEWIASELQAFLAKSQGGYPARTTAQLEDFISTIQQELTMTEHQENQQEKAQLYFDYYDELQDVQSAFENQWDDFTDNWGLRLAGELDGVEIVEIPDLPDNHVGIELNPDSEDSDRWIFRQGSSWAGIAKEQWRRRRTDNHVVIYGAPDDDNYAHITLYHRLEKNRKKAIQNGILELTLWHGNSSDNQFYKLVNERVSNKIDERGYELPPTVDLTSRTGNILTATYNIPIAEHDDFFDAYTAGLGGAFVDLVVENPELITIITEAFEESLDEYY